MGWKAQEKLGVLLFTNTHTHIGIHSQMHTNIQGDNQTASVFKTEGCMWDNKHGQRIVQSRPAPGFTDTSSDGHKVVYLTQSVLNHHFWFVCNNKPGAVGYFY